MAKFDETPILELGRKPIPLADPCGTDPGDNENYMSAIAEVAKVGRVDLGDPDWYKTEQDCVNVLTNTAKDMEIAASLGYALFKRQRYDGLAATLGLINELIKNYWDGMFPPRHRRRKARIEMLAERFTDGLWFRENPPAAGDFDGLDVCVQRGEELKALLTEKMPDDPPDFRKFLEGLKSLAATRPKQATGVDSTATAGATAAGKGSGGGVAVSEVSDVSGALNAILGAATFLRKTDAADPIPYAVVRLIKWSKISLPTSDAANSLIEPPEATVLDALQHQMTNQLWEHLLKSAESAFRSNDPLWLDLQRYTCASMVGLGSKFDKARETIAGMTGMLVSRLGNGLFDLRFRNGTPLCSGETRMWLEAEVLTAPVGSSQGGVTASDGRLTEATTKARKLAGAGKVKEALGELQNGLAQCTQRRDRLLWRLRIAQLCVDSQRLQLAAPILEECAQEIQRNHIDEWEPTLAVDVAQSLYRCRKALIAGTKDPAPEAVRGVRESFTWLCQLDPLAALAAEPT